MAKAFGTVNFGQVRAIFKPYDIVLVAIMSEIV